MKKLFPWLAIFVLMFIFIMQIPNMIEDNYQQQYIQPLEQLELEEDSFEPSFYMHE